MQIVKFPNNKLLFILTLGEPFENDNILAMACKNISFELCLKCQFFSIFYSCQFRTISGIKDCLTSQIVA